jgi:hypothetical protein
MKTVRSVGKPPSPLFYFVKLIMDLLNVADKKVIGGEEREAREYQ